jgi:hypothetical protein
MISSVTTSPPPIPDLPLAADGTTPAARRAPVASAAASGRTSAAAAAPLATAKKAAAKPAAAKATATGYAKASASASAKKSGPLAFLDDPRLSVEEKLLKLLGYLNDKWNKDLDKKMKELKQGGEASTTTASASKAKGGLGGALGSLASFAKSTFPQLGVGLDLLGTPAVRTVLSKVSGPGLAAAATAVGLPELAPLALKYGPDVVDAVAGAAASASRSGAASASGGGTSRTTAESASGIGSDRDAQLKLMEIQRIMDQQKEMFGLVSNLLRTGHDARMAVIQNIR